VGAWSATPSGPRRTATARLPLVFAAPFFILVGGGGSRARRLVSAGVGGVLPVAALAAGDLREDGERQARSLVAACEACHTRAGVDGVALDDLGPVFERVATRKN